MLESACDLSRCWVSLCEGEPNLAAVYSRENRKNNRPSPRERREAKRLRPMGINRREAVLAGCAAFCLRARAQPARAADGAPRGAVRSAEMSLVGGRARIHGHAHRTAWTCGIGVAKARQIAV
jgi:hypothetical protein